MRVVLLDALGTLLELEHPGPHLRAGLAAQGIEVTPEQAERAVMAEIAHYQANHHRAGTATGLADLRGACARVMLDALGAAGEGLSDLDGLRLLLGTFRFRAYPDALPALDGLRARGVRLGVVSNWDVSLHDALAQTGIAARVDLALSSAEAGAAKPDPAILHQALARLGGRPEDALMVGDTVDGDVRGAQAAGIRPVLVLRSGDTGLRSAGAGAHAPAGVAVVEDLREVAGLLDG